MDAIQSLIALFGFAGLGKGFDRLRCLSSVQAMLRSNDSTAMSTAQDPMFFFRTASGLLANDPNDPQLTLYGCNQMCGSEMGLYSNTPIRLLTWFIPAMLLVTNMQFEPFEQSGLFAIVHLFGNPIDSMWAPLVKLEEWSRCRCLAESLFKSRKGWPRSNTEVIGVLDMAAILSAIRELAPDSSDQFRINKHARCPCIRATLHQLYNELAVAVIDSRVHGTFRSVFSIILYVFGVISSFFQVLGGSSTPSGTILVPAMLLSWLLPAILLNNAVGQVKSSRDYLRIIWRLKEEIILREGPHLEPCYLRIGKDHPVTWMEHMDLEKWKAHFSDQLWRSGNSSCFQKSLYPSINKEAIPNRLFMLAFSPVALSFAIAFYVLYSPPTYFTCRHYIILGTFVAWLFSPIITFIITRFGPRTPRARFLCILSKDSIIAVGILSLLIASSCGLFNDCYCWSGISVAGHPVILNPAAQFAANDRKRYPETVGITLTMQLVLFFLMYYQGKRGFDVMKRSEKEKRNALPEALPSRQRIPEETQVSPSDLNTGTQVTGKNVSQITQREVRSIDQDASLEISTAGSR